MGSKESKGGDPSVREEDKCIAIRRKFERRVRDRPKGDPHSRFLAEAFRRHIGDVEMDSKDEGSPNELSHE